MLKILNPKSAAVIGASREPNKVGHIIFKNLLQSGVKAYPVNPNARSILGVACYDKVTSIPDNVDIAIIAVPAKLTPSVIEECGVKGIKEAIIISAGFKEAGNPELEAQLAKSAQESGIRILGPNVLGVLAPGHFNATFLDESPVEGGISFISQSGALGVAVLDWAVSKGIGFRYFISVGNTADIDFHELINELNNDAKTKVIALYIESLRDGRAFLNACSNSKKPIVVLKAGVSEEGKKAASSHTGALAGSYEIYEAAFRQCGARSVASFIELMEVSEFIDTHGLVGKKALVISNAGGPSILMTDALIADKLAVPKLPKKTVELLNKSLPAAWSHNNPIDVLGDARSDRYKAVFDIVKNEDFYDFIIVILTPQAMTEEEKTAEEVINIAKRLKKPVIPCFLGGKKIHGALRKFSEAGIFAYNEINEVADAISYSNL